MVQIIQENRKPSFSEKLNVGIGQGLNQFSQIMEKRQASERDQQSIEAGKNLLGIDLSGFDPETRKALLVEGLKQQGKNQQLQGKQEYLNQLFGGSEKESPQRRPEQSNREDLNEQQEMPLGFDVSSVSDEDIARATSVDPNLGRALSHAKDVALREKTELRKSKEKKEDTLRNQRAPLIKDIIESANRSKESIRNKEQLIGLIDKGDLDDPTFAAFATMIPFNLGKRLLSPDTVTYKGGLVDEFGDLKNIFKGATRVKEVEIYEDKLADIYLTDEQKKSILKSRINTAKIDLLREEAAEEAEEKFPNLSALQFNKKVDELMKPKMDALFNNIWSQQKAIIDQAESRKKMALDPNDPEDKEIMKQIFKEAGGDKLKAKKLAQKKGYTVKGIQ